MTSRRHFCLLAGATLATVGGCGGRSGSSAGSGRPGLESARLAELVDRLPAGDGEVVEAFWREARGTLPFVEPIGADGRECRVTFVVRGAEKTSRVAVVGCPTDREIEPLTRLDRTDLWHGSIRVPSDARFSYRIQVDGPESWPTGGMADLERMLTAFPLRPDPLNPRVFSGCSVVEGPSAAPEPWIEAQPGVPRGEVRRTWLFSRSLHEVRPVALYAPPGPRSTAGPVPVLVVLDGEGFGGDDRSPLSVPTILDNLIAAGAIPPVVAALVASGGQAARDRDMACSDDFAAFLARELVPWVADQQNVRAEGRSTMILGASLGGLAAGFAAWRHPDVFGNAVALSGAFSFGPDLKPDRDARPLGEGWLSRKYRPTPGHPCRFFLKVGRFERRLGTDELAANRRLRDVLVANGTDVIYREAPGGHDPTWWRDAIPEALIALLGKPPANPQPHRAGA